MGRSLKASSLEAMPDDRSDATGPLKTTDWGFGAQKHAPTRTLRSPTSQIRCDGFANFRGQKQFAALTTLAADAQLSRVPVDVFEFERRHFTGAQTQSSEQKQDRIVAASH